jgi:hypothetical protein
MTLKFCEGPNKKNPTSPATYTKQTQLLTTRTKFLFWRVITTSSYTMPLPKSKNAVGLGNSLMNDRFGKGKGADMRRGNAIQRTGQNGETVSSRLLVKLGNYQSLD